MARFARTLWFCVRCASGSVMLASQWSESRQRALILKRACGTRASNAWFSSRGSLDRWIALRATDDCRGLWGCRAAGVHRLWLTECHANESVLLAGWRRGPASRRSPTWRSSFDGPAPLLEGRAAVRAQTARGSIGGDDTVGASRPAPTDSAAQSAGTKGRHSRQTVGRNVPTSWALEMAP